MGAWTHGKDKTSREDRLSSPSVNKELDKALQEPLVSLRLDGGSGTGQKKVGRELVLPSRPQIQATCCFYQIGSSDEPAMEETDGKPFAHLEKLLITAPPLSW